MTYLQNVTMIIFQSLWKNLFRIIFIDFFKKKWRSKHNMQMRKRNAYILQKFRKKICLLAYSAVVYIHSVFFQSIFLTKFSIFFAVNFLAILVERVDIKFFSFTLGRMYADKLNQKHSKNYWRFSSCSKILAAATN